MRLRIIKPSEPTDSLFQIKRGLCGYISYLAACGMNGIFSEYVLYEPILRILQGNRYSVECEYPCPGMGKPKRGDKKRLDFFASGHDVKLAIEVKWAKSRKPEIGRDLEKLRAISKEKLSAIALLCVFGRKSLIQNLKLPAGLFRERGEAVYADLRKTRFGCRIFEYRGEK